MVKILLFVVMLLFAGGGSALSATLANQVEGAFQQCRGMFWTNVINPFDDYSPAGRYAECRGISYKPIFEQSGRSNELEAHVWLPEKGKVVVDDSYIMVSFRFDQAAIDFFKSKFVGSNARIPMNLEVDLGDPDGSFRKKGSVIGINIPDEAGLFSDTQVLDDGNPYGAVIRNPHELDPGVIYSIVFYAEDAPWYAPWTVPNVVKNNGKTRLTFQIAMDVNRCAQMMSAYDSNDHQLNGFVDESQNKSGGYDYFVVETDGFSEMDLSRYTQLCWYGKSGDDLACDEPGNPFTDPVVAGIVALGGSITNELLSSGVAGFSNGFAKIPTNGAPRPVIEEPDPGLPDFALKKLEVKDVVGKIRHAYASTETLYLHSWSENIGDADWAGDADDIYVKFYLSQGYKEDSYDVWRRVGTPQEIQRQNIEKGETKYEWTSFSLATANGGLPLEPGVYNIVACVDREHDEGNGDGEVPEKHESNNCSVEFVFEVAKGPFSRQFLADVNGDGRADAIVFFNTPEHPGEWWVAIAKPDGTFGDLHIWATWVGYESNNQFVSDVNADGRADIIVFYDDSNHYGEWWVAVSTENCCFEYLSLWASWFGVYSTDQFVGDVNGDGFADVVSFFQNTSHPNGDWYVALATANNSFVYTNTLWATWLGKDSTKRFLADVNGDGRSDVVLFYNNSPHNGDWYVGLATSQGTFVYTGAPWATWFGKDSQNQFVTDLNGDGFFEILVFFDRTGNVGQWYGAVSTGTFFTNGAMWADQAGSTSNAQLVGDTDGDGKWDIGIYYDTVSRPGEWWIGKSNPSVSQFQYISLKAIWVGATSWW